MTRNISIIIPHYQKQEALVNTWKELQLQLHPLDEIIIVDDNSPDGVPEFDCPCSTTLTLPKRAPHIYRLCTVRNYGLEHATHDACIILDPDCLPNPHFLDNARKIFDASILFGGCIDKIQEDGTLKMDTRRNSGKSYWCDLRDKGGGCIWGGCMMFSKSRTKASGWFDEDFNGAWGAEESEFASRCYHGGMRLRYSMELGVKHQWHPKDDTGKERNKAMYLEKIASHRTHLNMLSPYAPAVGVMVITMMRPDLITQCLQGIFRNRIPVKVRLINNGDRGEDTRRICTEWGRRWAVDYVMQDRQWPAVVRNESMKWARRNKFKYLVFIDDDMVVTQTGISNLISEMEKHPQYYAMSGSMKNVKGNPFRMLGGVLRDNAFWNYPMGDKVRDSDWVGGGFTAHRLKPLVPYDENYQTGYNDFDWSMQVKKQDLKLGVTGKALAYHGFKLTSDGLERYRNPDEYSMLRYDKERHAEMRKLFKSKWGFSIGKGGLLSE